MDVLQDSWASLNKDMSDAALMLIAQSGAQIMNWFSVACELHRDWRNDIEGLGNILSTFIPNYRNIMNSYLAQQKLMK